MTRILAFGIGPIHFEDSTMTHGSSNRAWQLCRPLLEAGHEILLACMRVNAGTVPKPDNAITRQSQGRLTYIGAAELPLWHDLGWLQSLHDEFRPDARLGVNCFPASQLARLESDAPLWADMFGYTMGEAQNHAMQQQDDYWLHHFWNFLYPIYRNADKLSTVSTPQRHALIGELGMLGRLNRYTVGYDFAHTIPAGREPGEIVHDRTVLRGELVPEDAFVVLWIGGYNSWSDPDLLFEGLERAMAICDRLYYVSTGGAIPGVDEETFATFQRRVEASPYRSRFVLSGWIDKALVPGYLLEANVGINVDRPCCETVHGARNRLTDMVQAGLPIVSTEGTEVAREIAEAGAGRLSPLEDPEGLARELVWCAEHPQELATMAANARLLFETRYTDEASTQALQAWMTAPHPAPDRGLVGVAWPRPRRCKPG